MLDQTLKYTVVGLGDTGISCVEYLQNNNCLITAVDSRPQPPKLAEFTSKFPKIPLVTGKLIVPNDTDVIVLSPGVSLQTPVILAAKERGVIVVSDIELFLRQVTAPIIGVTGSNGKSTVVTLVTKMLEACGRKVGLGGNIGTPVLSLLNNHYDCFVLELSSFQLETTYSLGLTAATILNISPDHLDRHGSLAEYRAAKLRIYHNAKWLIVNRQDKATLPITMNKQVISFGLDDPKAGQYGITKTLTGELYLAKGNALLLPITELSLATEQNILNALAALALVDAMGFSGPVVTSILKTFISLPHRCKLLGTFAGIAWIDDSKGTNVGATISAITSVGAQVAGKLIIILGGISKGADFTPLLQPVLTYCKGVIVIGEAKETLKQLFTGKIPCYEANDMEECVQLAKKYASNGDGVLLSPACSSLDMFENYQARGLVFKQAIVKIMEVK